MLDLTNCLDTIDKDNIELDTQNDVAHITAMLWLWDEQYAEIIDRCGISTDLKLTSRTIIFDTDIIINVYADISETETMLTAFVDTDEMCKDYAVELTEQEIKQLRQCFDNALRQQFDVSLSDALMLQSLEKE